MRKQGKPSGRILYAMRKDVEKPITAILTLNTVAHTAGASIAGAAWADLYGEQSLFWFAIVFTALILIISEIIPKTVGVAYSRSLGPVMAKPLRLLVWVFMPVIWVCSLFTKVFRRKTKGPEATEEDIRAMVSMTRRAGILKPYEELSIQNILSLDLKTVEQIMTPRTVVYSMPADITVGHAMERNTTWPHSRMPVYEGDDREDIIGMLLRRDLFEAMAEDKADLKLSDLMKPVRFVPENLSLDRLLIKLLEARMHLFVVLDEYGGVAGVVTLEDVLEEILGSEIVDESDQVVDMRELARKRKRDLVGTPYNADTGEKKQK